MLLVCKGKTFSLLVHLKENISPWVLHVFLKAHTTWLALQILNVFLGSEYECRFSLGHGEPDIPRLWEGGGLVDCWVSGAHTLFYFLSPQARRVTRRTFLRSSQRMKFIITCRQPLPRSVLSGSKLSKRSHGLGSKASQCSSTHPLPREAHVWI